MISYSTPRLSDFYTVSQNKLLEKHTLHSGTYLYSPYLAVPRFPGVQFTHSPNLVFVAAWRGGYIGEGEGATDFLETAPPLPNSQNNLVLFSYSGMISVFTYLLFIFWKIIIFFHVPGCSVMFRDIPKCSVFLVLSTPYIYFDSSVIHVSQKLFERSLVVYFIKEKILQKSRWEIYLVFDPEFVACLQARSAVK